MATVTAPAQERACTVTPRPSRPRRAPLAVAGAALALAALGLAGCGSSATSTSSGSTSSLEGGSAPLLDTGSAPQPGAVGTDGKASDTTGGVTAERQATSPLAVSPSRAVIVNSDMSVRVASVAKATDELGILAARYAATIDNQVSSRGGSSIPVPSAKDPSTCVDGTCPGTYPAYGYESSVTTLRLDNDKVDALLRDVAVLGTVEASSRSSVDVTAEVADVDSRVRNAEASLVRVRALLARATSISDIVALEAELSRRQSDLEALQARQRTLADQAAQATVTVRLFDEAAPVVEEAQTGFLAGLARGWDAFTSALVAALTVVGAILPFLLVLAPLALLVWVVVRRQRATGAPGPAPATAAAEQR